MKTQLLKGCIILFILLQYTLYSHSQDMVFGRADFIHGEGFDKVTDIHIDGNDNLYIAGTFEKGGNIGGVSVKAAGENTLFVAKYNKDGYIQYTKQFGGSGKIFVHTITTDNKENLYISGSFRKTCTIGNDVLTATDFQDNFLAKISAEGSYLWVKHIIAETKQDKQVIICDSEENLILAGSFYKTLTIDQSKINSERGSDLYFAKFSSEGKFINLNSIKGSGSDKISDIGLTDDQRLFIAGSFTESIYFKHKPTISNGKKDGFWAEVELREDGSLKVKEINQIGGAYDETVNKMIITDKNIYLTGNFHDRADFRRGGLISKGAGDIYLATYKLKGRELKAFTIGGKYNEYVHTMVMNEKGELYLIGNYRGELEVQGKRIETKDYQSDNFVVKFDNEGELKSLFGFGGDNNDFPVEAVITDDNIIYLTGTYLSDFTFGEKRSHSKSENNIFLSELYDCEDASIDLGDDIEICSDSYTLKAKAEYKSYKWSNGSTEQETEVFQSGEYSLIVKDEHGCPAEDKINVTLKEMPKIDLGEDRKLQRGEKVSISVEDIYKTYVWNGEESKNQLIIDTKELPKGDHIYDLEVTDYNGCKGSDQIILTLKDSNVGSDEENALAIKIVPNPSDGRFTLCMMNIDPTEEVLVHIFSPDGKLIWENIYKQESESLLEEINLQNKSKGDYLIKIIHSNNIHNQVLIISGK